MIGAVIETRDGRALVKLDANDPGPPITADNPLRAAPGDRVRLEVRPALTSRHYHLIYGLPLAGVMAGAVFGMALSKSENFADLVMRLGGPLVGANLAAADNLVVFAGFAGLGLAWLGSVLFIRGRRAAAPLPAVIEIIPRPLHPEPNRR